MYILGSGGGSTITNTVFEYDLSTDWSIAGGSISHDTADVFSVNSQSTEPRGLAFSTDGTKMWVVDIGSDIYQYTLSSAWQVNTASYDSITQDLSSEDTSMRSIDLQNDGLTMMVYGATTDKIYFYTLGSADNITTMTLKATIDTSSHEDGATAVDMTPDQAHLYIGGESGGGANCLGFTPAYGSTADKDSVTDVPVGSQFEETNTRKFYQYKLADAVEWDSSTFEGYIESTAYDKIKKSDGGGSWNTRAYGTPNLNAVGTTLTFTNDDPTKSSITGFNDVNTTTQTIGNAGAKLAIRMEDATQMDIIIGGSITENITGLSLSTSSVYKIEINSGDVKFYVDESGGGSFVVKHTETMTPASTYYSVFMAYDVMSAEMENNIKFNYKIIGVLDNDRRILRC